MGRRPFAILALLPLVFSASIHAELAGPATVTDGDTLTVAGQRVRLFGIDAPESKQTCLAGGQRWPCGRSVTQALERCIAGRPVVCSERDCGRYGRIVAVCRAGGEDVSAWMVSQGLALAYRRYSTACIGQERAAMAARRGLWRGEFVAPWDWRQGKRLAAAAAAALSGACRIKGNISRSGKRIYHVPGAQYYDRARIDTSKGERWFCLEAEARAAGESVSGTGEVSRIAPKISGSGCMGGVPRAAPHCVAASPARG